MDATGPPKRCTTPASTAAAAAAAVASTAEMMVTWWQVRRASEKRLSAGIKEVGQGNQEPIPFGRVPPRTDRTRRVPPRTKRTRRVPSPLLTGRAASPPWRKSSAGSLGEPTLRAGFKRVLHQHTAHCERRGSGGGHGKEREGQHAPEPGARRACAALAPTGGAQGSATRAVLVSRRRAGTGPVPVLIPHGALLLSRWEEASPPPS